MSVPYFVISSLFVAFSFIADPISGTVSNTGQNFRPVEKSEFDCSGRGDGYYPNLTSCSSYYICELYRAYYKSCLPGMLFSTETFYCEDERKVSRCSMTTAAAELTTPTTTTTHTVTTVPTTSRPTTTRITTLEITTHYNHRTTAALELHPIPASEFDCSVRGDGYFPNPQSCSTYYMCLASKAFHEECLPGTLFHTATLYCEDEKTVHCNVTQTSQQTALTLQTSQQTVSVWQTSHQTVPILQTTKTTKRPVTQQPTTPTRIPTTTHGPVHTTASHGTKPDCRDHVNGILFPDPSDCSYYYECVNRALVRFYCAGGLVFNPKYSVCDRRANVARCR